MNIIERFIEGKHGLSACEDGIVVSDNYVAVIDGSTSKTPLRIKSSMSNGKFAMELVAAFIRRMPATLTIGDFCKVVTTAISDQYDLYHLDKKHLSCHPEERLTASVIVYSQQRREVWMVGDCQGLIGDVRCANEKPSEHTLALRRAQLVTPPYEHYQDHDIARDKILPDLIEAMKGQNRTYSVVDGFPIPLPLTKVYEVPASVKEVILASDGYPFLCPTLQESERLLAKQLRDDPLNIHSFVATKGLLRGNISFDDRAYIRFEV